MASSRHLRRSRMSSPAESPVKDDVPVKHEAQVNGKHGSVSEEWSEPPLRTPAPSFADYKGLERHGVLEHMAPLGSLPGQKVKSRLKQHEPPRRTAHLKNGEARAAREDLNTPEPAPPAATRRSEPRKAEERLSKLSSSHERDEDHDYMPKGTTKTTSAKAASTHTALHGSPNSRTAAGKTALKGAVDIAVARSVDMGTPILGIAVKRLYEESLENREMADLLDAVLAQKTTPPQAAEFQGFIKAAKKQAKNGEVLAKQTKSSASKSPAKSARANVTRHIGTASRSSAPGLLNHSSNSNHRSSKLHLNVMEVNGSACKEERPSKRIKRSKSASSDSSLSSLDSAVEDFAPTIEISLPSSSNHLSSRNLNSSKNKPSSGPRLGSFSITRHFDPSTRKPIIATNHHTTPTPQELDVDAKKEKLKRQFHDVLVADSSVRSSPSPLIPPQSTPPIAVLSERTQQGRLRNGIAYRNRQDEPESLESPVSSTYGDLLVPPPPGAARGATPNQLGRPPKAVKKAARIKMSPLKKRNAVTAGIGRSADTENNTVGYLRTDDNQDNDNADSCASCSGGGKLLCCDGCWRSFHFTCLDPPMEPSKPPEGEWFCNDCLKTRVEQPKLVRGVFGELVVDLHKKNPVAFNLPPPVRNYFEGVKTGDGGEYEEASTVKVNKARGGYEEVPNNFKLKDGKESAVLCFRCSKSSMGHREIIPCDYCNLSWHLDCIDPPQAVPPPRRSNNRPRFTWICPNHIDEELANVGPTVKKSSPLQPETARRYKTRRPKDAKIVDIALHRGFKNNGLIEIENEASEDESEIEREVSGIIYRVPEKGLKLDFIDRVKRSNLEATQAKPKKASAYPRAAKKVRSSATKAQEAAFDKRPFLERKAALKLTQMAGTDTTTNPDKVKGLIGALIREAPTEVEATYTAEEAATSGMGEQEKKDLVALRKLIDARLNGGKSA